MKTRLALILCLFVLLVIPVLAQSEAHDAPVYTGAAPPSVPVYDLTWLQGDPDIRYALSSWSPWPDDGNPGAMLTILGDFDPIQLSYICQFKPGMYGLWILPEFGPEEIPAVLASTFYQYMPRDSTLLLVRLEFDLYPLRMIRQMP